MPEVNGIPESKEFKERIGRTGISSITKKKDGQMDTILACLQNAGYWRDVPTPNAIAPLRLVRKECISWLVANPPSVTRAARPHITQLLNAVNSRINAVIDRNFVVNDQRTPQQLIQRLKEGFNIGTGLYVADRNGTVTRGGRVGKRLADGYLVERMTSTHMPKMHFEGAFTKYKKANTKLKFETWVQQVLLPQSEDDPMGVYFTADDSRLGKFNQLASEDRVQYCNEDERKDYVITITAGVVKDASGDLYHTGSKETHFSGHGWAIYVVGMENTFYSNSHLVNKFHHSSFLAGAPVQGAGEIAVNNGKVVAVTNKTGHYSAGPAELTRTLFLLHRGGVNLDEILVNDPFRAANVWITGRDCLLAGGDFNGKVSLPKPATVPA
ncbi:MAG TPA: hypothetical protein VHV99_07540 [Paraburkholderia sp.]|jgi:hypothetical protein|nr:hypothetical protein [Paraburkholderia sp.]